MSEKEKCLECNGLGTIEIQIDCGKPHSVCCGGCTETIMCENCDGEGYIVVNNNDYDE
jgi:hypothetical protein